MRAQAAGARRNVSWAGRFMSMLEMISGKGSRDEKYAIKDFVSCCGYEATADHVWAVPRGVVWDAWDCMLQEPWEGLPTEPRTSDTCYPYQNTKAYQVTSNALVTSHLLRSYS